MFGAPGAIGVAGRFVLAVGDAALHGCAIAADPIDLQVNGPTKQLESIHRVLARFPVLFDLILDPFQDEVELPYQRSSQRVRIETR
jgi:hypothetical protein